MDDWPVREAAPELQREVYRRATDIWSLRDLDRALGYGDMEEALPPDRLKAPLSRWYMLVRDVPLRRLPDHDLARATRQGAHPPAVLREGVRRLHRRSTAEDLYEGSHLVSYATQGAAVRTLLPDVYTALVAELKRIAAGKLRLERADREDEERRASLQQELGHHAAYALTVLGEAADADYRRLVSDTLDHLSLGHLEHWQTREGELAVPALAWALRVREIDPELYGRLYQELVRIAFDTHHRDRQSGDYTAIKRLLALLTQPEPTAEPELPRPAP